MVQNPANLLLRKAVLGLLRPQMKLQQAADLLRIGPAPIVHRTQKTLRINRLHHIGIRQNHLDLVGLQMADEMPADVGRQLRSLLMQLLRTVLAEQALAGVIGLLKDGHRMEFRDCYKLDSAGDRRTDPAEIFNYIRHIAISMRLCFYRRCFFCCS